MPEEQPEIIMIETIGDRGAQELNATAVATACSLLWGCGLFFLTWWVKLLNREDDAMPFGLEKVYPGYRPTIIGSLIGAARGFVDAFIGGWLYARIYNFVNRITGPSSPVEET